VGNHALGLSQLPDDPERFPAARRVRNLLLSGVQHIDLAAAALVQPSHSDTVARMDTTGDGLASVINALETGPSDLHLRWIDHIKEAIPGIETITTRLVDGKRHVFAEMRGGVQLPLRRLSKGSILAIGLCTLGYQDRKDSVLIIEAPEAGIHPATIEAVAQGTMESASHLQIMLTTYSPAWVAAVPAERLRRFVREAGAIRVLPGVDASSDNEGEDAKPSRELLYAVGLL